MSEPKYPEYEVGGSGIPHLRFPSDRAVEAIERCRQLATEWIESGNEVTEGYGIMLRMAIWLSDRPMTDAEKQQAEGEDGATPPRGDSKA